MLGGSSLLAGPAETAVGLGHGLVREGLTVAITEILPRLQGLTVQLQGFLEVTAVTAGVGEIVQRPRMSMPVTDLSEHRDRDLTVVERGRNLTTVAVDTAQAVVCDRFTVLISELPPRVQAPL
nr:hypothetical protein [Amycolatopsis taiwanensis]